MGFVNRDTIADFDVNRVDRIDLSTIDAVAGGTDDVFAFINHAAFTALGQLRWFQQSGNTFVEVNTTGTDAVDMRIQITGLVTLDAGDFVL